MTLKQQHLHWDATSLRKKIYKPQPTNFPPRSLSMWSADSSSHKVLWEAEREFNKQSPRSEAACELQADALPKGKRLESRPEPPVSHPGSARHLPESCGLFLAIEGGQWHLFDRQEAAVFSNSIIGTMALERSRFNGWK